MNNSGQHLVFHNNQQLSSQRTNQSPTIATTTTHTNTNTIPTPSSCTTHDPPTLCDDQINIYYQNVRGLRTKSKEFFLNASASNHEVFAITETWLTNAHNSEEFFPNEYFIYRFDRPNTPLNTRRGGGTLIAVTANIPSEQMHFANDANLEYTCVKLSLNNIAIIIYCLYIAPNSPPYIRVTSN